jgi:hypothetical protein
MGKGNIRIEEHIMHLYEYSFTPSEYILLNGEKFSPEKSGENSIPLLTSDGFVDGPYLATLMCIASILANEEEQSISLEMTTSKGLFGLKEKTNLVIKPQMNTANWNGFTLESGVAFFASQAHAVSGDYSVKNTFYTIISEDREKPWMKIIEMVEWGLAASNWLMPVGEQASSAFSTPFICPSNVRELVLAQNSSVTINLLNTCKKTRPEIWRQLTQEITQAFEERKK